VVSDVLSTSDVTKEMVDGDEDARLPMLPAGEKMFKGSILQSSISARNFSEKN
jgi:hypothetical protein